jgi:hypothetical protein
MTYKIRLRDGRLWPLIRERWALYSARRNHHSNFFPDSFLLRSGIALCDLVEPIACETTEAADVLVGLFCADTVELRTAFPGRDIRCLHADYWYKNPYDPEKQKGQYINWYRYVQPEILEQQWTNCMVWNLDCTSPLVGYNWQPN